MADVKFEEIGPDEVLIRAKGFWDKYSKTILIASSSCDIAWRVVTWVINILSSCLLKKKHRMKFLARKNISGMIPCLLHLMEMPVLQAFLK